MSAKIIPLWPRQTSATRAHQLEVTLTGIAPPIRRRLRVSTALSLRELHHVLQIAFGWSDSHLHEFQIGAKRYGMPDPENDLGRSPLDERDVVLGKVVRAGDRFEYLYDFGDEWRHEIVVERRTVLAAREAKAKVLDGARAGPPDDAGGPLRYSEMLQILTKPKHKDYRDVREWIGPDFSPEEFDAGSINRALRGAGSEAFRRKRERRYGGR